MPNRGFFLDTSAFQPVEYQKYLNGGSIGSKFAPHSSQPGVSLAFPIPEWLTDCAIPSGGGDADVFALSKVIERLSPEHRQIVEALIRELAKIEGIEVPTTVAESQPEPLGQYIPAWQNSLGNEG
jgi:hypothetical protein